MKWKPIARTGVLFGSTIIFLVVLIDSGLLWRVVYGPLNGVTFVCAFLTLLSLPVMAVIGHRIYDFMLLRYEFDRNRLMIATAATKQIIPMHSIKQVISGRDVEIERMRTLTWPGYFCGQGDVKGIGLTLFYAAASPREQVIIVTPTLAYGISVHDLDEFTEVLAASQQIGPSVEVRQASEQAAYVRWPIWGDRLAQGVLLGGIMLNGALFALLLFRYPHLPSLLPMHYDIGGQVDRIAPRKEVFDLPIIGLITWAVNGIVGAALYRRQRMVSYLAWGGALIVQLFFLLALWNIVV